MTVGEQNLDEQLGAVGSEPSDAGRAGGRRGSPGFRFALGEYEPFSGNYVASGHAAVEFIRTIAKHVLHAEPLPQKLAQWASPEISRDINNHEYRTVAAPIFPAQWMVLDILVYVLISSAHYIVRRRAIQNERKFDGLVRQIGEVSVDIRVNCNPESRGHFVEHRTKLIDDIILQIASTRRRSSKSKSESSRPRVAAMAHWLEGRMFKSVSGRSLKLFNERDPVTAADSALDDNYLFLIDGGTIEALRSRLGDKFDEEYVTGPFLGKPIVMPAGFPFARHDSRTAETFKWALSDLDSRQPLDEGLKNGRGYQLLPPGNVRIVRDGGTTGEPDWDFFVGFDDERWIELCESAGDGHLYYHHGRIVSGEDAAERFGRRSVNRWREGRERTGLPSGNVVSDKGTRLTIGDCIYPLKRPLDVDQDDQLLRYLGLARDASLDDIARAFHFAFQRIDRTAPHDRNENEELVWRHLESFIDVQSYRMQNAPVEYLVGRLVYCDIHRVVIDWFGIGEESYDLANMPPAIIRAKRGDTVHGTLKPKSDGSVTWLTLTTSEPLRDDDSVLRDDESLLREHGIDAAPEAEWPSIDCK